jgi:hypothetical protein
MDTLPYGYFIVESWVIVPVVFDHTTLHTHVYTEDDGVAPPPPLLVQENKKRQMTESNSVVFI